MYFYKICVSHMLPWKPICETLSSNSLFSVVLLCDYVCVCAYVHRPGVHEFFNLRKGSVNYWRFRLTPQSSSRLEKSPHRQVETARSSPSSLRLTNKQVQGKLAHLWQRYNCPMGASLSESKDMYKSFWQHQSYLSGFSAKNVFKASSGFQFFC